MGMAMDEAILGLLLATVCSRFITIRVIILIMTGDIMIHIIRDTVRDRPIIRSIIISRAIAITSRATDIMNHAVIGGITIAITGIGD
jgi:hypothetical protein